MKIRTDFVTNSSATCTTEVIIDNPILLEILQRYRGMGTFGGRLIFGIGNYEFLGLENGKEEWFTGPFILKNTDTPAFYYCEFLGGEGWPRVWNFPQHLNDVLNLLLELMDSEKSNYNQGLYDSLKKELENKRYEINAGFLDIYWNFKEEDEEAEAPGWMQSQHFSYTPDTGEKYEEKRYRDERFLGDAEE